MSLDLRAVVRLALRAHGFHLTQQELDGAVAERWKRGCALRDEVLPQLLPAFVDRHRYDAGVRRHTVFAHFPHMLGFGAEQAELLNAVADDSQPPDPLAVAAGAAFSAGIAVLDYLADELLDPAELFEVLDPAVRTLFEPTPEADVALEDAAARADDPKREVLFALVGVCRHAFLALHTRSGNTPALRSLALAMREMYEAERTLATKSNREAPLYQVEAKSVLPFVAIARILALARPSSTNVDLVEAAARTLGRAVMLTDDLVDLVDDWSRGTVTGTRRMIESIVDQRGGAAVSDVDVYNAADRIAKEIVAACDLAGGALNALGGFARATVGGWVGWRDDRPETRSNTPFDSAVAAAAAALLDSRATAYQEAVHHLSVPRLQSAGGPPETRPALVFQRGIVLDALLDLEIAGHPIDEEVIASEAMTVLLAKHREARGGWNYIPEVTELPPDIDDLGMALQVLYRTGGRPLAAVCDRAVRLAADSDEAGGVSTWVVDACDSSDLARRMRAYVELTQSGGAHPEVVANFLYALLLSDPERHDAILRRGCAFLAEAQEQDGGWRSRWYAGPYYGTYRVLSVLATYGKEPEAVKRALRFIHETQQPDGGWGVASSEPLATAFALLALAAAQGGSERDIQNGIAFLRREQESDGTWRATPFIAFLFPGTNRTENYASRTVTTAFCVKALITSPP